jgi:predicted nucleic acid-binding Zn ribbon protein
MAKDFHDIQHVGDAIKNLLKQYQLKPKFDEANVLASWEKLVGKPMARHTKRIYIRNKVLFIELDSPSMKSDLSFHKNHLLKTLEVEFGKDVLKEIVLM